MLAEQEQSLVTGKSEGAKKKTLLVSAALALTACLSGAALYSHWSAAGTSDESEFGNDIRVAQGFAGFYFVKHALNWDQANHWCYAHGMRLATADSQEKSDRIHHVSGGHHVWVGYRSPNGRGAHAGAYRWVSGAPTGYARWQPGEPNNHGTEFCTEQYPNRNLNNLPCHHGRYFVCDKSPFAGQYAIHGVNGAGLTWDEADARCRIFYGSGLGTPADPEQMTGFMHWWQAPRAWMGLRIQPGRGFSEANFQFSSGQPRNVPIPWNPHEPNNWGPGEYCGEIHHSGRYNDLPCNARLHRFVCDMMVGNSVYGLSQFEKMGEWGPVQNRRMPAKLIDYRGRRHTILHTLIRMNRVTNYWGNIYHVGNNNHIRTPALWTYGSHQRRLHFRVGANGNWNEGCDPYTLGTPPLNHWFRIQVYHRPGYYEVKYNGHVQCTRPITLDPPAGPQAVWVSDPWHGAAAVSLRQFGFRLW